MNLGMNLFHGFWSEFWTSFLAFIEGFATITSPCIYPILPLLLTTTGTGNKYRPFAIMTGFFLNFTLFVFTARYLTGILGINLDYIKYASVMMLIIFGGVMLSDNLSQQFSALTSNLANSGSRLLYYIETRQYNDIIVGLAIGAVIALVWVPCAGPILGSALTQVIRQTDNLHAVMVVLAFAVGVSVPFLIIALLGRKALNYFGWLPQRHRLARKIVGTMIIVSALLVGTNAYATENKPVSVFADGPFSKPLSFTAPEFVNIQQWFNVDQPLTISSLRGKVVLINFWTYSCINCQRTLPAIVEWDRKYRSKGLVIIGVHSPEFEQDRSLAAIQNAMRQHGITYPVAVDNQLQTWDNYHNDCWPAFYFINKYGRVVHGICGEHNYLETEKYINKMLQE